MASERAPIEGWAMRYDHTARANRMKASALLRDMRRHLFPVADCQSAFNLDP